MGLSREGMAAARLIVDYVDELPLPERAFVSVYLTKLPEEAYEKMAHLFNFVKERWTHTK